jgi:hypothetical protein
MNLEHAIQTIAKRGFTDRQARFLVLVARHSGVCVMRQYSTFAGIVFGQKTRSSLPTWCAPDSCRRTTARTAADAFITCVIERSTRRSASLTAGFAGRPAYLARLNG